MTGRDGEGLSFHILLKSTHIWPIHKCNTIHSNYYIDPPLKSSTMARMLLEPWQEKLPVLLHTICTMECSMMVLKIHPLHPNIMELICEGCLCSKREYLSFVDCKHTGADAVFPSPRLIPSCSGAMGRWPGLTSVHQLCKAFLSSCSSVFTSPSQKN